MTNFPSSLAPTPTAGYNEPSGTGFTAAVTFTVTEATPVFAARWFSTEGNAGISVQAFLGTRVPGASWTFATFLATSDPVITTAGWTLIPFPTPIALSPGVDYAVAVVQTSGARYTATPGVFPATNTPFTASSANESAYAYGSQLYTFIQTAMWYGVDICSGYSLPYEDVLPITDSVTVTRSGLPTSVTLSASATDTLAVSATAQKTVTVSSSGTGDRIVRYLQRNRPNFSSLVDSFQHGPGLNLGLYEVGVRFYVQRACTLTGARIYKHSAATGSIPVTLWNYGTRASLGGTTLTWTAGDGGWVEFDLDDPVDLVPDVEYCVSYFANAFGMTGWRFNAQDYYEWPFRVWAGVSERGDGTYQAGGCNLAGAHGFPSISNTASWYWIDPRVEYDSPVKTYTGGKEYFDQWPNGNITEFFPISVFAVDVGFVAEYKSIGVNLPLPWDTIGSRNEIVAAGATFIGGGDETVIGEVVSDPQLAPLCKAYNYWDEPDMQGSGGTAEWLREKFVALRKMDSTRPLYFGFGNCMLTGQSFAWYPNGASSAYTTNMWREQATLTDMMTGDDYSIHSNVGIWKYGVQARRLRDIAEWRVPVWVIIETCIQVGGARQPTITEMQRAAVLAIIHGARGIVWFDHQFPYNAPDGNSYPMDFQAALHDPVKKAGLTTFHAFLQTIKDALWAPEANLLTSVVSSNKTAGPIGGVLGVPVDTTTRVAGANKYLLAQAGRPGTTTGTFTIASAASKTLTVLNESRTVSTNGSGQFTDTFTSDYEYHVYRWT